MLQENYYFFDAFTFWVDYKNVKKVADIQFPQPSTATVLLKDEDSPHALVF